MQSFQILQIFARLKDRKKAINVILKKKNEMRKYLVRAVLLWFKYDVCQLTSMMMKDDNLSFWSNVTQSFIIASILLRFDISGGGKETTLVAMKGWGLPWISVGKIALIRIMA